MAYDSSRGRTVLFGGMKSAPVGMTLFNDTTEWDGQNWTQVADTGPSGRYEASMAYDAQRNQTVLFGGGALKDTWGWDGRSWTQLADSGLPFRARCPMVYDSKRQRIVLFSGHFGAEVGSDTWEWDGSKWTEAAVAGPKGRNSHMMAYDSTRDRIVLFGGWDNAGVSLGDTWEWNGSVWTQVSDFGATPCAVASCAFKGDSVALFGGLTGTAAHSDQNLGSTWTWDGRNWTLRQNFGPSPRWGANMCYDSKRGTLVLYGGGTATSSAVFSTETWEHSEGP
jgi:hypothetical protein